MVEVSVIIPAYNSESTLLEAVRSVEEQTFKDYEVIVVDDASQDRSVEIAKEWAGGGERRRVIALDRNGGPARARNEGVRAARGEWLAFLDADDAWLPRRLETQLRAAESRPEVALWCAATKDLTAESAPCAGSGSPLGTAKRGEDGSASNARGDVPCACEPRTSELEGVPLRGGDETDPAPSVALTLADLAVHNPIATSSVLVRKSVVEDVGGFDEQFRGPEDYDLWLRVVAKCPVRKVELPLSTYRHVDGSLSMDDRTFLPEVLRVLHKAYAEDGALSNLPSRARRISTAQQYLSAAWMAANRGALCRGLQLLVTSLLKWPLSFEPYLPGRWRRLRLFVGILRQGGRTRSSA